MQEPELRKEPSLLLDGMEMHINRRELEREWEQIDALLPPCFPPDCQGGEEGEQSPQLSPPSSEVQNKMIIMGHQLSSCHVTVVRSFFIL